MNGLSSSGEWRDGGKSFGGLQPEWDVWVLSQAYREQCACYMHRKKSVAVGSGLRREIGKLSIM